MTKEENEQLFEETTKNVLRWKDLKKICDEMNDESLNRLAAFNLSEPVHNKRNDTYYEAAVIYAAKNGFEMLPVRRIGSNEKSFDIMVATEVMEKFEESKKEKK